MEIRNPKSEIRSTKSETNPKQKRRKLKTGKPPGQAVKRIELTNVDMNLTLEDQSSFPAGDRPAARNLSPEEKSRLLIRTLGPFHYDVEKDLATFDVAPAAADAVPQCVEVVRASKTAGNDVLQCDHLEVQFQKKSSRVAPAGEDRAHGPEKDVEGENAREAQHERHQLVR